jgi:gliding motility-associated-like protein
LRRILLFSAIFLFSTLRLDAQWAHKQAGAQNDETRAVAGDDAGNTYTTGYFSFSAQINGINLPGTSLSDVFVSKIGPNGSALWSKAATGGSSNQGLDVAVDNTGNVYICGFYGGTLDFGGGVSLTSSGGQDMFVAKYSSSGNIIWARSGGGATNSDRANALAVDNSGNVFVTGEFSGTADYGGLSITSLNGTTDVFILKYDTDGNEEWIKKGSGEEVDRGLAIVCDNQGNVYACGQFDNDITFDNFYDNDIQNALFVIKYTSSGNEEWFRWGGGSGQSIAYDITTDGSSVYITGDFGPGITFFNTNGQSNSLSSGFDNSIFIVKYSGSGSYDWGSSEGSDSFVTSRGISYEGGNLAIGGWYNCTFQSYSDEYGESTFNSIGFEDVYVARYSSSGSFTWARNFGSQTPERIFDVELHSTGMEVAVGSFNDHLVIPLGDDDIDGLSLVETGPGGTSTYCGDDNYTNFGKFDGEGFLDGFTLNVIDPDRAPYDFYMRYGTGCDLSIPELCIDYSQATLDDECPDELIGCSPYYISAINQVAAPFEWQNTDPWCVGYNYNVQWNPPETGEFQVTTPTDVTATITSEDGCYSSTVTAFADVHPDPSPPLLSDSEGVNNQSPGPFPVVVCPGTEVTITADYNPDYDFYWTGFCVDNGTTTNPLTVIAEQSCFYVANVENEFGCISTTIIQIEVEDVPPIVDPFLEFDAPGDTLTLCEGANGSVATIDALTDEAVQTSGFDWTWSMQPATGITGGSSASFNAETPGWYVITVEFETEENPCGDQEFYTVTDSIYVQINPVPETFITADWTEFICPGDSAEVSLSYDGELEFDIPNNQDIEILVESDSTFIITGEGYMIFTSTAENEFGCTSAASVNVQLSPVDIPEIISDPPDGVICPGDSIQLVTEAQGELTWQGPEASFPSDSIIYVTEPGSYFLEVFYYEGCALVSNTIELVEYSTPFLIGSNAVICEGDSVEISVNSSSSIDLVWLDPLSGSDSVQVITQPGTYYAEISSCGITVVDSIQVDLNQTELVIQQDSIADYCEGDSILIYANYPFAEIFWTPDGEGVSEYFTESGTVQAFAVDTNGCQIQSNTLNILFNEVPPPPTFDFETVCEGAELFVSINSNYTEVFTDPEGNPIIESDLVTVPFFISDTTFYAYYTTEFCQGPLDSVSISPILVPGLPILDSNSPVCTGDNATFIVVNDDLFSNYVWINPAGDQNQGAEVDFSINDLDDAGPYLCYGINDGCIGDTASISIDIFETIQVSLPPDTAMCLGTGYVIEPNMSFDSYFWQDGSTDSVYTPLESGTYTVLATDLNGCESADFMELDFVDCNIDIPNVFTPNNDGFNDEWVIDIDRPLYVELLIFNRWGRKVFESNEELIVWDGVHYKTGEDCSEGTYFFILKARTFDGAFFEATGNIELIRD